MAGEYGPYKAFFAFIQRDWRTCCGTRRILRCGWPRRPKRPRKKTAPPEATHGLAEEACADLRALRSAARETALATVTIHDLMRGARRLALIFDPKLATDLHNAAPASFDHTCELNGVCRAGRSAGYASIRLGTCFPAASKQATGLGPPRICLDPPWNVFPGAPGSGQDWSVSETRPPPARRRAACAAA